MRYILVPIAYIVVLVVNGLAGSGYINNTSPGDISDLYSTVVSPAGYAFSIWSVIYLGLGAFSVYQALPSHRDDPQLETVRTWFLASCAANIGWLFSWHYDIIPLSLFVMLALVGTLVMANRALGAVDDRTRWWLVKAPFALYLGWLVVAATLNTLITTVYFDLGVADSVGVGAVAVLAASAIGIYLRRALESPLLPLAMAWGVAAIAVAQGDATAILVVCIISVVMLAAAAVVPFGGRRAAA